MSSAADRRDTRRIFVGPEYTIRFTAQGRPFRQVRVTNLSLGGCFATVERREASAFRTDTVLDELAFDHPGLPGQGAQARVAYAIGGDPDDEPAEFVGLGIQFTALPADLHSALEKLISRSLG